MSKRRTVRDFPQEYFDIWKLAVLGRLRLTFGSKGKAVNKKVDLQIFRKRLGEESPELANEFFQVDLLAEGDESHGILTSYIPDWKRQVRDQLAASDLSSVAIAAIAETVVEQKQDETKDAVGGILKDLGFKAPNQ